MVEEGGFEPPVRVDPARLFSKQLVSATHPLLRHSIMNEWIDSATAWGGNQVGEASILPRDSSN